MWKTIKYNKKGEPLIDINEQGVFYSYYKKSLKKFKLNNQGYLYWAEGNKTRYVHQEVAIAFPEICGEWFDGCEVHHKDGNKLNNEAKNLIVCTKEQHIEYHRKMKAHNMKYIHRGNGGERFEEALKEFKKNGKYRVTCYCRESKKRINGMAPIEVAITQHYKRFFRHSSFYAKPNDFAKGIFPKGFIEYYNTLLYNETDI